MPVSSILVYVTSDADNALGENVLKLPLLLALSTSFPSARISWVPGTSGEFHLRDALAPLVGGRITEFITDLHIPTDPRTALFIRHPILKRHFDLIIDTQRYLGRTLFLRRIPHERFISGTWRYLFSDARPPRGLSRRPPRLVDKLLGLVAAAAGREVGVPNPIPLPPALRSRAAELLPTGAAYVAFAPGAGVKHTGKCWPLDRFIELARQQLQRGRAPVFVIGPAERDWYPHLREAVPQARFPIQRSDEMPAPALDGPSLVVALAERVSAAVANCSGPGHLLAAGGAPMVSLYGPSRPEKYAPFSRALICIKAQDFGSEHIEAIPLAVVAAALEQQVAIGPAAAEMIPPAPANSATLSAPVSADKPLDEITDPSTNPEHITSRSNAAACSMSLLRSNGNATH
jgi:ADP-heptose:LPS heptosyltransferase